MNETTIDISEINPVDLYGINDSKLTAIKKFFPRIKIIARGNELKAIGDENELSAFKQKIALLIAHLLKYKQLTENNIERLMSEDGTLENSETLRNEADVLVFGNSGLIVKAKTANQRKLVEEIDKNDMVFAVGPAGTGKSYTAVALAVRALKNKEVRRIILTRPAVEAGENLGFLPGDLKEKLDPYLQPLYDALRDMIPSEKLNEMMDSGIIQIAPLAFMRGRTLDKAFVILDEAQNATNSQFKMFLTRMGKSAKFIINGDPTQIDLPKNQPSGLMQSLSVLKGIKGISFVQFDENDVIRHQLVKEIIMAYSKSEK
ncbi:MAG: PhoH family protein [Flavobacteriales bacterium]|nr:PhoH family protein [Flavobacteriales bacterium]MCW8914079.1 PhoH family protein [Flavobacteriales bacterium]MCW8938137.1 PhoH family protein [Flavobacteriales bacterium]MCW8968244.1 PhoH family protein [Flavobacteriales bacterium]MCW8991170.1 PhoH family protein [Flavobacteriales bacterium]